MNPEDITYILRSNGSYNEAESGKIMRVTYGEELDILYTKENQSHTLNMVADYYHPRRLNHTRVQWKKQEAYAKPYV